MSPESRAPKFFALGSAGGAPLLLLGEFGQVSKAYRKWNIKIENKDGATIEFTGNPSTDTNKLLKGKWSFLHKSKSEGNNLFRNGSFDMAVPADSVVDAYGEPSLVNNVARIFFCTQKESSGYAEANIIGAEKKIYCKDVTEKWYFGFINGSHFGATFAVKPKGILSGNYNNVDMSRLEGAAQNRRGVFHEKLIEMLKLATRNLTTFRSRAEEVNTGARPYNSRDYRQHWCGESMCFLWGTIGSKKEGEESAKNCDEDNFKGCNIGIIDVSRYTLGIWDIH